MVEEKFCRVCRCEGTPDQPLFHPCKCRGSIKYIHQDCLQYWLEHSNKDICDICHSKFKFKIIYNDGVPDSVPLKIILKQFFRDLIHYQYQVVKYSLMIFCAVFEVPTVISLIDKIIDFQLGVPIRIESPFLPNMFEDYKSSEYFIVNYLSFLQCVIFHGLFIAMTFSVIIISMIIIQNSFVGDEGFQKIIDKKIGPQRRKLVDLFQLNRRRRALRGQENEQRVNRELESVGWVEGHVFERAEILLMVNSLHRMIEELVEDPTVRDTVADQVYLRGLDPEVINDEDIQKVFELYKKYRITLLNHRTEEREMFQVIQNVANRDGRANVDDELVRANARLLMNFQDPDMAVPAQNIDDINEIDPPIPAPVVEQDDGQEQLQGMWDGPKNITFIFQLTLLANLVSMVVLVCFKLIPSYQGMLFLSILDALVFSPLQKLFMIAHPYFYPYISLLIKSSPAQYVYAQSQNFIVPKLILAFFQRNLILPLRAAYVNSVQWTPTSSSSERIIVTLTGFAVFGLIIFACMKKMERSCTPSNPLAGNYRTIYIVMLQIASIVKVFSLIAIEWAIFPLFCGMQIEFALVPIFNDNLYNYKIDPPFFGTDFFGVVPKWFMGTYFMYFFASFVSMIRSNILRDGVLFFIRPSDDPNLQLVHDALMRPFSLRLSRISLSAAVYSLYIHIEFSAISWGIRLFSPIKILPFHNEFFHERALFVLVFILGMSLEKSFCKIWKAVFKFACSQLRLSSFLLDEDNPKERGKIIYKTLFAKLTNPTPDYSEPVLESETDLYFATHTSALCCFVPDGNYVRAPNDDHVSRNFVRTLFVPVTKSDQLLAPIPEYPDDDEIYNPYGDVDPMDVTTYTIVYRPPDFKWRLFALFGILWLASMLITLALYVCNILIGEPLIKFVVPKRITGALKIPTEWYKVDIYGVIITLLALPRLEKDTKAVRNQWSALIKAYTDSKSNGERVKAIKIIIVDNINKLREHYRIIGNNPFVKTVVKQLHQQFILAIGLSHCGSPVLEYRLKTNRFPLWSLLYFASYIPLALAFWGQNKKIVRLYFFTAVCVLCAKTSFTCFQIFTASAEIPNHKPKTESSYTYPSLPGFLLGSFFFETRDVESWIYFSSWILISSYTSYVYIVSGWRKFKDKTKQMYFDNMKVLSNADDGDNEDSGESNEGTLDESRADNQG